MLKDRVEAGQLLGEQIRQIVNDSDLIVLAIPRGGVIVGHEIAKKLDCLLDVIVSKKITPPDYPEYGIGAITHDGTIFQGPNWESYSNAPDFAQEIDKKKIEAKRRLEEYRGNDKYQFDGRTVLLVDDGIATGSTIFVLLKWLATQNLKCIILAVPVIPVSTYEEISSLVEEIVALEIPVEFSAVGQFYSKFDQVTDNEVIEILTKYKSRKKF